MIVLSCYKRYQLRFLSHKKKRILQFVKLLSFFFCINAGRLITTLQLISYKLFYFAWFNIMPTFLSYYNNSIICNACLNTCVLYEKHVSLHILIMCLYFLSPFVRSPFSSFSYSAAAVVFFIH